MKFKFIGDTAGVHFGFDCNPGDVIEVDPKQEAYKKRISALGKKPVEYSVITVVDKLKAHPDFQEIRAKKNDKD